ncbi:sn-glycerol-3-phosphate ABC transporter ATP-binding protein UgpC [Lichenibacterium minor]|uniref:sn-glycerol-3-phosphate ABC transporter ATP-binding protein UgpC n=1 Tax=Lichenibacterium minor TaxID=2316528 RepID=A0A4Q2U3Z9_9HYPH|nr:sn-glycerol-3-phosphate ABC transporter ATP-binding protein UgpC [Lichenibacterium minor]RYC29496.1 sn-glycerol-3-phosphate ABC transporter ATP-binding protein UgpC [Lichenibacterium minor]
MSGVELRGVTKSYGAVGVIHGIDLSIADGDFVVFVGPSGCGKSTLLRMIAGLEEVTGGDVVIAGRDVTDADPSERGIAMVFQSYALYPHMSVRENMGFGLKMMRQAPAAVASRVDAAAEILKLGPLLDRKPSQLSGGQRQRVAIGHAIVRDPKVFLFDEPLSNLDAELRVSMRIEIARLHRELGNTMIYVTHDQTEAMTLADKIVVLRAGRVEQAGTPAEVYDDPANTFVTGFIGSPRMNLLGGRTAADGGVTFGGRTFPAPVAARLAPDRPVQVGLRPEHLREARPGEASLGVTVGFSEFLGGTSYVYGEVDGGGAIVAERRRGPPPRPGDRLDLAFDPADLRLFDAEGLRLR